MKCRDKIGSTTAAVRLQLFVALFTILIYFPQEIDANYCTTRTLLGGLVKFTCPRLSDDYDERHCCGLPGKQTCCDYDDYLEENPRISEPLVAVAVLALFILVGLFILAVCCFCSCCYLAQRRQGGRGGIFTRRSAPTTVITTPASQPLYQHQTGYQHMAQPYPQQAVLPPMYPPATYPQQTPYPQQNLFPQPQEYGKPPPYYEH